MNKTDKPGRKFVANRKRRVIRKEADKIFKPILSEDYTLQQALTIFIRAKEAENVRPRTIQEYIRHIQYLSDYMTEILGLSRAKLSDLDADLIRGYIRYLLTNKRRYEGVNGRKDTYVGLSPTTVNIRLRTLKTMCRFWYREGMSPSNAMENIKSVNQDEVDEVEGIDDSILEILLASYDESQFADWRDKVLCLLLLDTGLRPTEAAELTIDRVDFATLALSVPSQVSKVRTNREVPISKETAKMLKDLYEESLEYFGETEFVFNTAYGEPFSADSFRKRLNRRKDGLGISKLSPNMFRHTFCRDYLLNGGDLFTLQRIVDHRDIKTTRKYVQMNEKHIRHQHNKYSPAKKFMRRR